MGGDLGSKEDAGRAGKEQSLVYNLFTQAPFLPPTSHFLHKDGGEPGGCRLWGRPESDMTEAT